MTLPEGMKLVPVAEDSNVPAPCPVCCDSDLRREPGSDGRYGETFDYCCPSCCSQFLIVVITPNGVAKSKGALGGEKSGSAA